MPVNSFHPEYSAKINRWRKNRDAYDGEDAVKGQGETYLIAPGGFKQKDYDRYKQRAKWFGATARTVEGLTGAVFAKDPQLEASNRVEMHIENITLTGLSLNLLASVVLSDSLLLGRYAILLDWNSEERRPYWSGVPAECLVNWKTAVVEGKEILTRYVIKEEVETDIDEYASVSETQYRVGHINADGQYQVDLYRELDNNRGFLQVGEPRFPSRRLRGLDFIPLQFFGARDLTPHVQAAPMSPLVDVNYAYYRHSADYEHGLFMTGLPTPVITGHTLDEGESLPIGSLAAWVIPNADAKAYLLEPQGHGLNPNREAMQDDKIEMATLGARLLEEKPDTPETFGAVRMRHAGEHSILGKNARLASSGITRVLRWHHWWNGDTEDREDRRFQYHLNMDFSAARISANDLRALMELYQAGRMSDETLFWNLQQGEIIPDGRTFEDEQTLIASRAPARIPFGDESADAG